VLNALIEIKINGNKKVEQRTSEGAEKERGEEKREQARW